MKTLVTVALALGIAAGMSLRWLGLSAGEVVVGLVSTGVAVGLVLGVSLDRIVRLDEERSEW